LVAVLWQRKRVLKLLRKLPDDMGKTRRALAKTMIKGTKAPVNWTPQADFGEWLRSNPAPQVGDLLARYGSYSAIPQAACDQHEIAMTIWQDKYRIRHAGRS
jgi:hypothetical protein